MVLKLVRLDNRHIQKVEINLPVGEHSIGRDTLLNCDDLRISRNHGQIVVSDDSLKITATHQNPWFYTKNSEEDQQILNKDSSIVLYNGDKFGLLPTTFWFKIICTSQKDEIPVAVKECGTQMNEPVKVVVSCQRPKMKSVGTDMTYDRDIIPEEVICGVCDGQVPNRSNKSTQKSETDESYVITPTKRRRCEIEEVMKNIKLEPVEAVKSEADSSGPSGEQPQQNASCETADDTAQNDAPAPSARERCMYGSECYRRNPAHLSQYSHPQDPDYGDDPQVPCPYGSACRKTDARHLRDHLHPPRPIPLPPPNLQRGKRKNGRQRDVSPTSNQDLIVSGKRVRKAIPRVNSTISDTDSEPDPYGTDESDEWKPDTAESQDFSEDFI